MYRVDLNSTKQNKKKKHFRKLFIYYSFLFIFLFLSFFIIDYFFFGGSTLFSTKNLSQIISSGTGLINKFTPLELENTNGETSILIAGIDTRNIILENGEFRSTKPQGQAGTRNIDTIIQVVYDHKSNELTMISVPRDLGVDFDESCLKFSGSIHWIYDKAVSNKCPGKGVSELSKAVESVTGIPVHYYVFVTLDSFVEAIETVGETNPENGKIGIYVDNPTDVWDVYPYNDYGWENVHFKKGKIFLTGEDALKYARARQLTTDFGRARRQQMVIKSVIERVLSTDTLLDVGKITELYKIYKQKTLVSEFSLKEIIAGVDLIQKIDLSETINIVLDPSMGGEERYLDKQPHNRPGGPYYMVPTHWKECPGDEFCRVKNLIQSIIKEPNVYHEEANVFAYATSNKQGKSNFDNPYFSEFEKSDPPLKLTHSKYLLSLSNELKANNQVVVIDFSDNKFPNTLNFLSKQPGFSIVKGGDYQKYRLNKEDFTIIVISN